MELEGVVHNGVVVPDDASALPEGARVRITLTPTEPPKPFAERYAAFKGCLPDAPEDLAGQHDHYRLDEQSDDPAAVARWIAAFDAIPALPMTPAEEAAWHAAREAVNNK